MCVFVRAHRRREGKGKTLTRKTMLVNAVLERKSEIEKIANTFAFRRAKEMKLIHEVALPPQIPYR